MAGASTRAPVGLRGLAGVASSATPRDRDRFVDAVRGGSILAVVVGHWLVTQFVWQGGTVELKSALGAVPAMWPFTWVLQVIPLFFFVGGYANRRSWRSAVRRGEGYAAFVDRRVHRLLGPCAVFLAAATIWSAVEAVSGADVLGAGGRIMLQPLWFLGIYVAVIALTPVTMRWHERWGWRVVLAYVAVVAVVEVVRLGLGRGSVAYVNVIVVWVMAHQIGYLYGDGWLTRARAALLAGVGLVAVTTLVASGVYPARMVGVPGDRLVNMNPPTAALTALAFAQIGVTVLLRDRLSRVLQRPRVWAAVVVVNLSIMSIYLWHQVALAVVARVGLPLGLPQPNPGTGSWWATRPLWFVTTGVLLVAIVRAVGRWEHGASVVPAPRTVTTAVAASVAVLLLGSGLLALAGTDATEMLTLHRVLRVLDVAPVLGLVCVAASAWVLRRARHGDRPAHVAMLSAAGCFLVTGAAYATGVGPFTLSLRAFAVEVVFAGALVVAAFVARSARRR